MPDGSIVNSSLRVTLGDRLLDLPAVWRVAVENTPVDTDPVARARMDASSDVLAAMVSERRRIYGVTTGYGPLACHYVLPEHAAELQRNLLLHLATGVGRELPPAQVRAVMLARASSLSQGYSAIGRDAFDLLLACLNEDLLPIVPEMGTVGASGDLTPLSHIALVLIGEGEAIWRGVRMPGGAALRAAGLTPVTLGHKEGLALVNGTAAMTGIAALNGVRARRAAALGLRLGLLYAEVLQAPVEAFDARFGAVRPHPGQRAAHARLLELASGSRRLTASCQPPPILEQEEQARDGVLVDRPLPQAPYTARCLPQVFGAILDLLDTHDRIVETELNAGTDNPLVFAEDHAVLHGGNFFGQHVGYAADILTLATVNLAVHAERSLARLCQPDRSGGLPPFLQSGPVGRNSGFMGAQVTASALVAEMRSKAMPASIQSIPTNNDNQDVVTMGTIAARKTSELLDLAWHVLAIHAMALAQAVDLTGDGYAPESAALCAWVRGRVPPLERDRALSAEIMMLAEQAQRVDWDQAL